MSTPFDTAPDFVNELGVKWWRDPALTDYAQRADSQDTSLEAEGWIIETPEGHRTRLLISKTGSLLASGSAMDDIGMQIDVLKLLKRGA